MKHRRSKIKVEHGMIKGLKKLLTKLSARGDIRSIIPGRIKTSKTVKQLHLTVQYAVSGGIKCLARGDGIQEVFFILTEPTAPSLIQAIEAL